MSVSASATTTQPQDQTGAEVQVPSRQRLHITPFTPDTFSKIIPPSLQALATNISFHKLETFPEKGFGYVDLPAMEAEKLRKKLNGATLKGEKVKIQPAKPDKRRKRDDEPEALDAAEDDARAMKRDKKKRKLTEKVQEGFEIPSDRKVKRGWTESAAEKTEERIKEKREKKSSREKADKKAKKKMREASKYTNEPEMLFRTQLEPVAATTLAMKKSGKDRSEKKKKEKKGKKQKDESVAGPVSRQTVVVHEFEHTTKQARFLKDEDVSQSKPVASYEDDTGWLNDKGDVVEAEVKSSKRRRHKTKASGSSVVGIEAGEDVGHLDGALPDSGGAVDEKPKTLDTQAKRVEGPLQIDTTQPLLEIQDTTEAKAIHPLEALYKRPKPTVPPLLTSPTNRPPPLDTSRTAFSFFDAGPTDAQDDASPRSPSLSSSGSGAGGRHGYDGHSRENGVEPATPFTERDMRWRGMRSAAPPPDTPGGRARRVFTFDKVVEEEEEEEEEDEDEDDEERGDERRRHQGFESVGEGVTAVSSAGSGDGDHDDDDDDDDDNHDDNDPRDAGVTSAVDGEGAERAQSEIAKWFYETRGDNNRAWRRRRREVLKVKRQTENRKYARRVA